MAEWASDGWMEPWSHFADPRLLHAAGLLGMFAASIEHASAAILHTYAGLNMQSGPLMTNQLTAESIDRTLREFMARNEPVTGANDEVRHALACAAICRTNRNLMFHFIPGFAADGEIYERRTVAGAVIGVYLVTYAEVRTAAEQASAVMHFMNRLQIDLNRIARRVDPAQRVLPQPWLDRPPLPTSLRTLARREAPEPPTPPPASPA